MKSIKRFSLKNIQKVGVNNLALPVNIIKKENQNSKEQVFTVGMLFDFLEDFARNRKVSMVLSSVHNPLTSSVGISKIITIENADGCTEIVLIPNDKESDIEVL